MVHDLIIENESLKYIPVELDKTLKIFGEMSIIILFILPCTMGE